MSVVWLKLLLSNTRYRVSAALALGLLLFLTACGGGGSSTATSSISGQVTVPAGGSVTNVLMYACLDGNCNSSLTKSVTITATGESASFVISGLVAGGNYGILGYKDVNLNGAQDDPDYIGQTSTLVVAPTSNISVTLDYVGDPPSAQKGAIEGSLVYPGTLGTNHAQVDALPFLADSQINQTKTNDLHANMPLEVVPGDVLVRFKPGSKISSQSNKTLSINNVTLQNKRSINLANATIQLYNSSGLNQAETLALVDTLRARDDVLEAIPNFVLHSFKEPNDEFYPLQWHYGAMNLPTTWDSEDGTSSSVTVAVVDSGIVGHPDLVDGLLPGYDFISDPAVAGDGDGRDSNPFDEGGESGYHGSHVAGTVAATTNNSSGVAGVSWGAKIVAVRTLGITGSGSFVDILDGTAWAAGQSVSGVPANSNPAKVINMSLGGDIGEPCANNQNLASYNSFFQSLAASGVVVVVAAGNDNVDMATTFPASCDGVITVGATGPQNTRAPYSNFGSGIEVMASGGDVSQSFTVNGKTYPTGVLSTLAVLDSGTLYADYGFYQGTSMASPHVAGIAALMLSKTPGLTPAEVLTRLQNSATPLSASDCNTSSGSDCGAGFIDANKAVNNSGGGGNPNPNPTPTPTPPPTKKLTTYVAALYCTLGCNDFDETKSAIAEVEITSSVIPYALQGLEAGTYYVAGWQDLDDDSNVDENEPFGVHPNAVSISEGQTKTGIIIIMETFTPSTTNLNTQTNPETQAKLTQLITQQKQLESFKSWLDTQ